MNTYLSPWAQYGAMCRGRASRTEYWTFILANLVLLTAITQTEVHLFHTRYLEVIFQGAAALPTLMVGIRRMHDVNRSGWWLVVPGANIMYALQRSDSGPNRFGERPQA